MAQHWTSGLSVDCQVLSDLSDITYDVDIDSVAIISPNLEFVVPKAKFSIPLKESGSREMDNHKIWHEIERRIVEVDVTQVRYEDFFFGWLGEFGLYVALRVPRSVVNLKLRQMFLDSLRSVIQGLPEDCRTRQGGGAVLSRNEYDNLYIFQEDWEVVSLELGKRLKDFEITFGIKVFFYACKHGMLMKPDDFSRVVGHEVEVRKAQFTQIHVGIVFKSVKKLGIVVDQSKLASFLGTSDYYRYNSFFLNKLGYFSHFLGSDTFPVRVEYGHAYPSSAHVFIRKLGMPNAIFSGQFLGNVSSLDSANDRQLLMFATRANLKFERLDEILRLLTVAPNLRLEFVLDLADITSNPTEPLDLESHVIYPIVMHALRSQVLVAIVNWQSVMSVGQALTDEIRRLYTPDRMPTATQLETMYDLENLLELWLRGRRDVLDTNRLKLFVPGGLLTSSVVGNLYTISKNVLYNQSTQLSEQSMLRVSGANNVVAAVMHSLYECIRRGKLSSGTPTAVILEVIAAYCSVRFLGLRGNNLPSAAQCFALNVPASNLQHPQHAIHMSDLVTALVKPTTLQLGVISCFAKIVNSADTVVTLSEKIKQQVRLFPLRLLYREQVQNKHWTLVSQDPRDHYNPQPLKSSRLARIANLVQYKQKQPLRRTDMPSSSMAAPKAPLKRSQMPSSSSSAPKSRLLQRHAVSSTVTAAPVLRRRDMLSAAKTTQSQQFPKRSHFTQASSVTTITTLLKCRDVLSRTAARPTPSVAATAIPIRPLLPSSSSTITSALTSEALIQQQQQRQHQAAEEYELQTSPVTDDHEAFEQTQYNDDSPPPLSLVHRDPIPIQQQPRQHSANEDQGTQADDDNHTPSSPLPSSSFIHQPIPESPSEDSDNSVVEPSQSPPAKRRRVTTAATTSPAIEQTEQPVVDHLPPPVRPATLQDQHRLEEQLPAAPEPHHPAPVLLQQAPDEKMQQRIDEALARRDWTEQQLRDMVMFLAINKNHLNIQKNPKRTINDMITALQSLAEKSHNWVKVSCEIIRSDINRLVLEFFVGRQAANRIRKKGKK